MGPMTVAVLAGGLTHEREISLNSGRRVAESLRASGIQVKVLDVDAQLLQRLDAIEPDVVWPLVHGSIGEDGSLQDLLVLAGVPFVGTESYGCRLASDKAVASSVTAKAGLRVPASTALPQTLFREVGVGNILNLVEDRYSFPLVVKPTRAGSSMGLSIVKDRAQLPGAMVDCFAYGDVALIQQFISGREFGVGVADLGNGPKALPPVEINATGPYDYDARYNPGRVEYIIKDENDEIAQKAMQMAEAVHKSLGLRHYSRTDIIVDAAGEAWFLDINVAPGMTETSIFPQAAAALARQQNRTLDDVYLDILKTAAVSADESTN